MLDEPTFRHLIDDVFARIDRAFENADPDLVESSVSQGALTITFREKTRFIVSPQTPVRQIWVAFRDRAWHFDRNEDNGQWLDDRGAGVELFSLVENTAATEVGVRVAIARAA